MMNRLEGRLDTKQYLEFLNAMNNSSGMLSSFSYVHDHYPVHSARSVRHWIDEHPKFNIIHVPKMSGDLNLMWDVWGKIAEFAKSHKVNTIETLCSVVSLGWRSIVTEEFIDGLIKMMPYRLHAVIAAQGGPINQASIVKAFVDKSASSISDRCATISSNETHSRY